jgi:hypothetical protein
VATRSRGQREPGPGATHSLARSGVPAPIAGTAGSIWRPDLPSPNLDRVRLIARVLRFTPSKRLKPAAAAHQPTDHSLVRRLLRRYARTRGPHNKKQHALLIDPLPAVLMAMRPTTCPPRATGRSCCSATPGRSGAQNLSRSTLVLSGSARAGCTCGSRRLRTTRAPRRFGPNQNLRRATGKDAKKAD